MPTFKEMYDKASKFDVLFERSKEIPEANISEEFSPYGTDIDLLTGLPIPKTKKEPKLNPELEKKVQRSQEEVKNGQFPDVLIDKIIKTNKEYWEQADKYYTKKALEAKGPITGIPLQFLSAISKAGNILSPQDINELREMVGTASLISGGAVTKGAIKAEKDLIQTESKAIIKKAKGEKPKDIIAESRSFINDLDRHLTRKEPIGIEINKKIIESSDEVTKGIDNIVIKKSTPFKEAIVNDWQRVKDIFKTEGLKLSSELTPYERRKLMFKRISNQIEDFANKIDSVDKDFIKTSEKLKIKDQALKKDVYDYLIARHAPERNAVLGEKAAGITDQEASQILNRIERSSNSKEIKRIADDLQKINNDTLDILYANGQEFGVLDEKTYKLLREKYKNHVPLYRLKEGEDLIEGLTNRGLEVKGSGLKRAKGSKLPVRNVMENIYVSRIRAVQRIEKNIVDNETYNAVDDFIKSFPEQELFEMYKPKAVGKTFDDKIIQESINDPSILQFQRFGKPTYIKINDQKLALALRGVNREQTPSLIRYIGSVTRWMAGLSTRYNPEFVISNKIRDMQEALIYMASENKNVIKTALYDPKSVKDINDFMFGRNTSGAKLYAELRTRGGAGGGMSMSTRKDVVKSFDSIIKTNRNDTKKLFKGLAEKIDHWNVIFEDSTRLSAYKSALKDGLTKDQAAVIAKNVSIDFDEMGTWGPLINSLYMFSNASIQGSAKMLRAMKNPKVLAETTSIVGVSVFAASNWNDSIDPNWKNKVSDWDRINSLNVVIPGEEFNYIAIPVSWGLKPLKVVMDHAYDLANGKDIKISDASEEIITALWEGYNPISGSDISSMAIPSAVRPLTDIAMNKSWTGWKIRPDYDKYAPRSIQYFESLGESGSGKVLINITRKLSDKGIEISPADINYVLESAVGGAGRFAKKSLNTISAFVKGEKLKARDIPVASRVWRETPPEYIRDKDEQKYIQESLTEISKKNFYSKQELKQLFKEDNPDFYNYIMKQPLEDRVNTVHKIIDLIRTKGIDDIKWYNTLKRLPPELRAKIFMGKYNSVPDNIKQDMLKKAGQVGGVVTDKFLLKHKKQSFEEMFNKTD